jgi:hypothetical protein
MWRWYFLYSHDQAFATWKPILFTNKQQYHKKTNSGKGAALHLRQSTPGLQLGSHSQSMDVSATPLFPTNSCARPSSVLYA